MQEMQVSNSPQAKANSEVKRLVNRASEFLHLAIDRQEGLQLKTGAFAVQTGQHTGRASNSRFVVEDTETKKLVDWGAVNRPFSLDLAKQVFSEIQRRLATKETFVVEGFSGPFALTVTTPSAWHAAFTCNMFRSVPLDIIPQSDVGKTIQVYHDPHTPARDYGVDAPEDALIILDPTERQIAIIGTAYAGEIKKSVFSLANYLLPKNGILPMHASANCQKDGQDSCVIFGLSGTGKTTLSAQDGRYLIGDDEIVWSKTGLANLEGGCYAKLIRLSPETEPEIFKAVNQKGAILENVAVNRELEQVDFFDATRTENTRGSYPLSLLDRVFAQEREAEIPKSVVFLTADAFGALPAVARLDEWQMRFHFISGFTAKVAGTEIGLKEPTAAFSACFGAPFMPLTPATYANLLVERVRASGARVYLLNTGWRGGYKTGSRFPLAVTRKILSAIQSGEIEKTEFTKHPVFGFDVPSQLAGVDPELLVVPSGPEVLDLALRFVKNAARFTGPENHEIITRGGPRVATNI